MKTWIYAAPAVKELRTIQMSLYRHAIATSLSVSGLIQTFLLRHAIRIILDGRLILR